jgi:phage minor structural protein
MIPILYESNETQFTSNGLGRLRDCIECLITEERNGIYECDFSYPMDGAHFDDIILGRIIAVTHDDSGDVQPFDIVSYSKPIEGVVKFHAVHISYRQLYLTCYGSNVNSISEAFQLFATAQPSNPFSYDADFSSNAFMAAADTTPRSVRQMIGGVEGSFLDAYGGEIEWDRFNVHFRKQRGIKRDFSIRHGVNMLDFNDDTDYSCSYSSCIPFWHGQDSTGNEITVIGSRVDYNGASYNGRNDCVPLDLTEKFESQPTSAQLESMATSAMNLKRPNLPSQNIKVDFLRLQDMSGYEQFESLLQCNLCDTITVVFPRYNMEGDFKIVRTVYDTLAERYVEMELGALSTTLAEALGISTTPTPDRINENFYVSAGGDITYGGYIEGLYKITTVSVSVGAISAGSYEAAADRAMTAQDGFHAVAIAGYSTFNHNVRPTTIRIKSDTVLFAGFHNDGSGTSSVGTFTFRVLWLKATSA